MTASSRVTTHAIVIDCPRCHAPAGVYCNGYGVGVDLCDERVSAARARTRKANLRRKSRSKSS